MVIARLENLQSSFVLQVGHFDLLLQFDVFLLALVKLHDLDALLLHQTSLLDVELFFGLMYTKCLLVLYGADLGNGLYVNPTLI